MCFPSDQVKVFCTSYWFKCVLCGTLKFTPSARSGKISSFVGASPVRVRCGCTFGNSGMLFRNVLKLNRHVVYFVWRDRSRPARHQVLKRLSEFCRSVAEEDGVTLAAEAAAVSVERLNE